MITRRVALGSIASTIALACAKIARADSATSRSPVLFIGHGAPDLPIDPVRSGEMTAWGKTLATPNAFVVITPHFAARHLAFGATGKGFGMYDMPLGMKKKLPQDLDYATPPSEAIATRVTALLSSIEIPARSPDRRGFDHTTWLPLRALHPAADAPVLELTFPYWPDADLFALGRALAPLRREGIVFVGSGQITHNLASMGESEAPSWSREFDAWVTERLEHRDVDAIVDWRNKAPAVDFAHPDDGGHFRVLIAVLGVASVDGFSKVTFPLTGFTSTLSRRCAQID